MGLDHHDNSFRWAVGIEGSCIPHLNIDQYEWTQHDRQWREDFRRVSEELRCSWMRYSLCWHLIETQSGVYDWSWADERIAFAKELGINLILDLAHFGTPTWLPEAFGDVECPMALERFSREFGRRYAGRVNSVCPLNEPLITSLFCGDVGLWPPHGRSLMNYMTLLSRVSQGLSRSIRALRETMPGVEIVLCDALEFTRAEEDCQHRAPTDLFEKIQTDVLLRNGRRHIVLDLITGKVDTAHPLRPWLERHGFSACDLNWFLRNPVAIDLLGLDYYAHSEIELYPCENDYRQRVPERLAGLYATVHDYWQRHRLPIMITETNCYGDDTRRSEWLKFTVSDIRRLRNEGIPVVGYTWWPLVDHLDWDGAMLHRIGRIHHVGLYRLERQPNGELKRVSTPLTGEYRSLVEQGDNAVGDLAPAKREKARRPSTNKPARLPEDFPIIVHCHLRWDGVWQRPQQFLSRLSQRHRVLFVEGPRLVGDGEATRYELQAVDSFPNVTVMRTYLPASRFHDGAWVDAERLRLLRAALNDRFNGAFRKPVQWFYDPMAAESFAGNLDESAIVYDCMDELSQFKFAPPEIVLRERKLLSMANVVFCGGRRLWTSKKRFHPNCHFYGCGVDVAHFSKARHPETLVPHDVHFIKAPVLGYFGVIDERLDYALLKAVAQENPTWNIVMVGPLAKVDVADLPCSVNMFWLGQREYAALPAYARHFDLCLMPFALNEATEFINPTKALEYMAAGRPIISTAVPDVVSNFGHVVRVAQDHGQFVELCQNSLSRPDGEIIECGLKMAEQNSWESIVGKLEEHVKAAIKS